MTRATDKTASVYDLVSETLRPSQQDDLARVFQEAGERPPEVIWSPAETDLRDTLLRQFHGICRELADADGTIAQEGLRLDSFGPLMDWIMLVDANGADTYTYRYYGAAVADAYGRDMTGQTVSAFGGHITGFFGAVYAAAAERREWIYTEHEPPSSVFVRSWHRLIVPLTAPDGSVNRFLALNVPENELSAGLELMVDPVFVIDADHHVVHANGAAHSLFHLPRRLGRERTLEALTGIALETSLSPSEMLKNRRREDTTQLAMRGAIVERLIMTTSAAQLRGSAFYVVIMRMLGA